MYTRQAANDGGYGGLGRMWFAGADPTKVIPRKPKGLDSNQVIWGSPALKWVKILTQENEEAIEKLGEKRASYKKVWWAPSGPRYGVKPTKGTKSEYVPKPDKKYKAAVQIVRDMPRLDLDPIPMPKAAAAGAAKAVAKLEEETAAGFGEFSITNNLPYIVLGLLLARLLYNK